MSRFLLILLFLTVLGTWEHLTAKDVSVVIKVEKLAPDGTILARPYIPPFFNLKPEKDNASVKAGEILDCVQVVDTAKFKDHADTFVSYVCGNGKQKFTLNGVFFAE